VWSSVAVLNVTYASYLERALTTAQLQGIRTEDGGATQHRVHPLGAALAVLVERPGPGLLEGLPRARTARLGATIVA
jgi:hypothetical protein